MVSARACFKAYSCNYLSVLAKIHAGHPGDPQGQSRFSSLFGWLGNCLIDGSIPSLSLF